MFNLTALGGFNVTAMANGVTGMKVEGCPLSIAANGLVSGVTAAKLENDSFETKTGGIQISTKILNLFS